MRTICITGVSKLLLNQAEFFEEIRKAGAEIKRDDPPSKNGLIDLKIELSDDCHTDIEELVSDWDYQISSAGHV